MYVNKYVSGVPYMAHASDISSHGVGLTRLLEPEKESKRVGLQFQLPDSNEVIYAEGEVVQEWQEIGRKVAVRSGVRFTLLTERHRRMIDEYVNEHAQAH
jgi:hypothetical protein